MLENYSYDATKEPLSTLIGLASRNLMSLDPDTILEKCNAGGIYERAQRLCKSIKPDSVSDPLRGVHERTGSMILENSEYDLLALRLALCHVYNRTSASFFTNYFENCLPSVEFDEDYNLAVQFLKKNHHCKLDTALKHDRDELMTYCGLQIVKKIFLLCDPKNKDACLERPQHMFMRIAIQVCIENKPNNDHVDVDRVIDTYDLLSQGFYTHASPTMFNAGKKNGNLASCFLVDVYGDSLYDILNTVVECGMIFQKGGGIGLNLTPLRCRGSAIKGTGGSSGGITPAAKMFNALIKYVQEGGRRPGVMAVYIEPWHADVLEFLSLKKNNGLDEFRARDLFYGLWIPDKFMTSVWCDETWYLMDPKECPDLIGKYGAEFDKIYQGYVKSGNYVKSIKAVELWQTILKTQIETGGPYILFKDTCNLKSNQSNVGPINSSNLCTEIIEVSSDEYTSVCTLASVAVNKCVKQKQNSDNETIFEFDPEKLTDIVTKVTHNLNNVLDSNVKFSQKATKSNSDNRPIGIGIQGLADLFFLLGYPFESVEARKLNILIAETIYHASLSASCDISKNRYYGEFGHVEDKELRRILSSYPNFIGSPVDKGILHMDTYGTPVEDYDTDLIVLRENKKYLSSFTLDWASLKEKISKYGIANSLLIAYMPTATTAQIFGNNESFEPYHSNVYSRRLWTGEYTTLNLHLVRTLCKKNMWTEDVKNNLIKNRGSVAGLDCLTDEEKKIFKTVWEIPQRSLIRMAADRAPFIDQSQSMNLFIAEPDKGILNTCHFLSWKSGLKTGMYYLRMRPTADPYQFSIKPTVAETDGDGENDEKKDDNKTCNDDICLYCN